MTPAPPHILHATAEELAAWLRERGEPSYRLDQILGWLYERWADSFKEMTNLSKDLREELGQSYRLEGLREVERLDSENDPTKKFLFELNDGERIESVGMVQDGRPSFCISSQSGCALGCAFCATGAGGAGRNLAVWEILQQVRAMARAEGSVGNIVFMGMGEPLLNVEAVIPALEALTDPRRFGIGARRITVSTAGVTPGIRHLANCPVRPGLALSLNSPFEKQRSELMPVNRRYPLREVLEACAEYTEKTGRRLMLEYVLLGGVNTSPGAARAVADIALQLGAIVNLIAFNRVDGCPYHPPERAAVHRFRSILEQNGITVTERYRRGRDIGAACGQLRAREAPDR